MSHVSGGSAGGGRARIVVLGGLSAFGPLSMDLYLPALPQIEAAFEATPGLSQLSLSLCLVGLGLGQLIGGPMSDRRGRRPLLLVGVAAFVLAVLGSAFAPTIELLLVSRLVTGLAGAVGLVVARAMVRDLFEGAAAARAFSLVMVVSTAVPVLAPVVGGQILRFTDWRGIFVFLSCIGFLLFLGALWLPESLRPERRSSGGPMAGVRVFGSLLWDPRFLVPALAVALFSGALFTYITLSPFVLQGGYGLSPQGFSIAFAVNAAGIIVSGRINAALVGRVGPARMLFGAVGIALVAAIALTIGVLATDSMVAALVPLFLLTSCLGCILPNAMALALADRPSSAGSASALLGVIQFGFGACVPPLASLAGVTALTMALAVLICTALATIPAALLMRLPAPAVAPG
ncbi:Drug resistance transporter%2C Bcr/CflA family [Mycobacterium tuberculosis]|nr:Drug resistance transporter%2C Bcr/CflA family [Mycobacterium tuberculosis]